MALLQLCFVREIPPQERRRKRSDQSQVNSAAEFLPATNAVGVGVGVGVAVAVEGVDCGRRQKTASASAAAASKQCEYKKPVSLPPNQIQPSQACLAWKIRWLRSSRLESDGIKSDYIRSDENYQMRIQKQLLHRDNAVYVHLKPVFKSQPIDIGLPPLSFK